MRVVFDSNVYVSALAVPGGVADQAMQAAVEGACELALSQPILTEVLGVLARKFARDPEQLARTALFLSSVAEIVTPGQRVRVLSDDPDNRVLECALAARADAVVTGDRRMLSLGVWQGIQIVSLREFVDRIARGREVRQGEGRYRVGRRGQRGSSGRAAIMNVRWKSSPSTRASSSRSTAPTSTPTRSSRSSS